MSTDDKVSVVVVNYNSTQRVNKLVTSLVKIKEIIEEIIIIDNNSDNFNYDQIIQKLPCKIVANSSNLGFAKAVNMGINISINKYILLLNPDCVIVDKSPIKTFSKLVSDKNIGIIGGRIINDKGETQLTATNRPGFLTALFEFTNLKKIFPHNHISKQFWPEITNGYNKPFRVFSLCGAYMFLRKELRFDEKYFMYLEDMALGNFLEDNNYEAWFDPDSKICHIGGQSNSSKYRTVLKYWYKSRKTYFLNNEPQILGILLYIIYSLEEISLSLYHKITNTPNE